MRRVLNLFMLIVLLTPAGVALSKQLDQPDPPPENNEIWYVIDLETTPLAREIDEAAGNIGDENPLTEHKKMDPKELKIKDQGGQDKKVGWMSQNKVTLDFKDATQKGHGKPEWDPIKVEVKPNKGKDGWEEAAMVPAAVNNNRNPNGPLVVSNGFLSGVNDDKDCVDQITGERFTGNECFKNSDNPPMVETLIKIEGGNDENYCQHRSEQSIVFSKDECKDRNWTTLEEMIDEDGPEDPDVDGDGQIQDIQNGLNDDEDCVDSFGTHYPAEECNVDDRFELIDEDLRDAEGNVFTLDNDGDGLFDEDPSEGKEEWELCQAFYIQMGAGDLFDKEEDFQNGECNMDRAITEGINKMSQKQFGKLVFDDGNGDSDPLKKKDWKQPITIVKDVEPWLVEFTYPKGKAYDIQLTVVNGTDELTCGDKININNIKDSFIDCEDNGDLTADFNVMCDGLDCTFDAKEHDDSLEYQWQLGVMGPGDHEKSQENGNAYGKNQGPRQVTVTETMLVQCKPGWEYEEDPNSPSASEMRVRCKKTNDAPLMALTSTALTNSINPLESTSITNQAMMGFTFAPPVIEWGWKIEEEVCIFGFCFEIFYARVGYEFDLGVGLRLPVEVKAVPALGWPDDIWAEDAFSFETSIKPLDFSTADYIAFCNENNLDDEWYIDSCERFSFPNFLNPDDGDEFVAYYSIFAGIIVRVLGIPIINWGVDSSFDLVQACTLFNAINSVGFDPDDPDYASILTNLASLVGDYATGEESDFYEFLKEAGILCGSFTTPYGYENGELRTFPIPEALTTFEIPADCINAITEGKVVTIKGKPYPICTNLILGTAGANLGIGIILEVLAGSENIGADWSTQKDARPGPTAETSLMWNWPESHSGEYSETKILGPVIYDNYDLGYGLEYDDGLVLLDDFTYYLDFWVTVSAKLEFGGILSPLPDIAKFKLFDISFGDITGTEGIPLPQHPGMDPIVLSARVQNYGVEVEGSGVDEGKISIAETLDGDYLAPFDVKVINIGSLEDSFDNFHFILTNNPQAPGSNYVFDFNHDNDFDGYVDEDGTENGSKDINDDQDCINSLGVHFTKDTCFNGDVLNEGFYELIDEDPADDEWTAEFVTQQPFETLAPYNQTTLPQMFVVHPFKHSMTAPALYPARIFVDSVGARTITTWNQLFPNYLPTPDHQVGRWDAYDVVFVEIVQFFDPQPIINPNIISVLPGETANFDGKFKNGGNVNDTLVVSTELIDFNQGGCDLVSIGTTPECPYRSIPTSIQVSWVTDDFTGTYPSIPASASVSGKQFIVTVPDDWAGMENTPYLFEVTAISLGDINASNTVPVIFEVQATKKSQIIYIAMELEALIMELEQAGNDGVKTCGVNPITLHPIQDKLNNAFTLVMEDDPDIGKVIKNLETAVKITEGGLMHTLEKCNSIPSELYNDWHARVQALLDDMILASE